MPAPRRIADEPGVAEEGELVRLEGEVVDVQRLGDRWRAEVRTSRAVVVVAGLAGAGIPSATLAEGGRATVTGVVRRPHPAATDRRFAVVPREPADIRASSPPAGSAATPGVAAAAANATARPPWVVASPADGGDVPDADLAALEDRLGRNVRVGGLVLAATATGVSIDDGTATGEVRLVGEAAAIRTLLEPGDAVSAIRACRRRGDRCSRSRSPTRPISSGSATSARHFPSSPESAAGAAEDPGGDRPCRRSSRPAGHPGAAGSEHPGRRARRGRHGQPLGGPRARPRRPPRPRRRHARRRAHGAPAARSTAARRPHLGPPRGDRGTRSWARPGRVAGTGSGRARRERARTGLTLAIGRAYARASFGPPHLGAAPAEPRPLRFEAVTRPRTIHGHLARRRPRW